MINILTMELRFEQDVVAVRQRARQIAGLLGLDLQMQTRVATAVSEIARNAYRYAGGGKAVFAIDKLSPQHLWIRIEDEGPGIANLSMILDGQYKSETGMGLGIIGARRLVERFDVQTDASSGTRIALGKLLTSGSRVYGPLDIAQITGALAREAPQDPLSEVRQQNTELMQALALLEKRELELSQLNKELADTNRGVIALNSELEDNAIAVKRASEIKSHFLTLITHEFRTPVNSILSLTRVLMAPSERDPVSPERVRQVGFIRKAAESLSDLVNDILDTAKAEAGRLEIHPNSFAVDDLFGALRAMFRPLLGADKPLELIFNDDPDEAFPRLFTDEGKVAQILRNFISNALKFTEKGRVTVSATLKPDNCISFAVSDTGIGIKASDLTRVFEDFTQIENPHQRQSKGTGLGLPLARKLSHLLGGRVSLQSEPGQGSTFEVTLPLVLPQAAPVRANPSVEKPSPGTAELTGQVVLSKPRSQESDLPLPSTHDNIGQQEFRLLAQKVLAHAREGFQSYSILAKQNPSPTDKLEQRWPILMELTQEGDIDAPAIVIKLQESGELETSDGRGAVEPSDQIWFLKQLHEMFQTLEPVKILIIDDDEVSRYVVGDLLKDMGYAWIEAADGPEGIRKAHEIRPQAIFLDLRMPCMNGFEVLEALKSDPATRAIPVIINSSKQVVNADFAHHAPQAILSKDTFSCADAAQQVRNALIMAGLSSKGDLEHGKL